MNKSAQKYADILRDEYDKFHETKRELFSRLMNATNMIRFEKEDEYLCEDFSKYLNEHWYRVYLYRDYTVNGFILFWEEENNESQD